jgi:hypothetical protein
MDGEGMGTNAATTSVVAQGSANGGRYVEYMIGMHGALVDERPSLSEAIERFAREAPTAFGKAVWGYDAEQGRGWLQIAEGASADERVQACAAFDRDMRRRGLVPIAPAFLR